MSTNSSGASQLQSIAANFGVSTGGSSTGSITSAALFPEVITEDLQGLLLKENLIPINMVRM